MKRQRKGGRSIFSNPIALAATAAGVAVGAMILSSSPASASPILGRAPAVGRVRVGVWVRPADLADPAKTIERLKSAGASSANIMLNDFAKARSPTKFSTFQPSKIIRFAGACRKAGLAVDLTSWVMPHDTFIGGMASAMPELLEECDARRLYLDAEEPWTQAKSPLDYDDAARKIHDAMPAEYPLALTAIGFARDSVRSLARICDYWSPQAYSTLSAQDIGPERLVTASLKHWREWGSPRRGWVMGLAAYNQPQPAAPMMALPIAQVISADIGEVCYWASTSIGRKDVASFIKSIAA